MFVCGVLILRFSFYTMCKSPVYEERHVCTATRPVFGLLDKRKKGCRTRVLKIRSVPK